MRLNKRWFEPPQHEERKRYAETLIRKLKRFVVNHSGRRSWKTETAKRALVWTARNSVNMNYLVGAPVQAQAKRVYWSDFKALTRNDVIIDRSDGDLWLKFATGSMIQVAGMDKPERFEGFPWHGVVLDEYGNMKANTLDEVVLPMLADTKGWLWALGVPEGRNHYFDLVEAIRLKKWRPDESEIFHWHSREIMDAAELAAMEAVYDEQMFSQEFGGEFVHFAGRAYYAFNEKTHCKPVRDLYDPKAPLVFCFDFNVDPGVAVVCQERQLRNGLEGTACIGEVYIPRNSNTEIVSNKLCADWKAHEGHIYLYGDYTGGARGSAKIAGSDWVIIKQVLGAAFGKERIHDRVKTNPNVRDRINAVNGRLRATNGDVRMMVDPRHCPHLIKDFEGVTILEGSAGELDKKSAPQLTHISDAIGYYIHSEFGPNRHKLIVGSGARF